MKALNRYVKEQNQWGSLFGRKPIDLADPADRQRLANRIDNEVSPENLSCDGELPRHVVMAKYKRLIDVARELRDLDRDVRFNEVDV